MERAQRAKARTWAGAGTATALAGFLLARSTMGTGSPWLVALGAILLAAGLTAAIIAGRKLRELERKAWERFCKANGWGYIPLDRERPRQWPQVAPFGAGNDRKATDVVLGVHKGLSFEAWNYQFTVPQGKSSRTYVFRVGVVAMPRDGPGLTLCKETVGHKLYDALGGEDIDFESHEFSRKWWVRCRDRRFAYDVVDARMMEALEAWGTRDTWMWNGPALLVAREGRMRRGDVLELVEHALAFRARVPGHVMRA